MRQEDTSRLEALCRRHPGLELIGLAGDLPGIGRNAAWMHVVKIDSEPSLVFPDERTAEVEDAWWRLARSHGLISADGTLLVSVSGAGLLPWARVRLPDGAPVLDVFKVDEEDAELVARSEAGDYVLALTAEEDETWIYLVDCRGAEPRTIPRGEMAEEAASRSQETPCITHIGVQRP